MGMSNRLLLSPPFSFICSLKHYNSFSISNTTGAFKDRLDGVGGIKVEIRLEK